MEASVLPVRMEIVEFQMKPDEWFAERRAECDSVYCLPEQLLESPRGLTRLFGLSNEQLQAELNFSAGCSAHGAIGIYNGQWIKYEWLNPTGPQGSDDYLRKEKRWTEEMIREYREDVSPKLASALLRTKASVGRRIASPDFLSELSGLKNEWQQLPEDKRPSFPVNRALPFPSLQKLKAHQVEWLSRARASAGFAERFSRFCDHWEISHIVSWELPVPIGPQWPAITPQGDTKTTTLMTPVLFPIQTTDQVGIAAAVDHNRRSHERGIDDHSHWKKYAQFLDIHHWETVLRARYTNNTRHRPFVTELQSILATLIHVDVSRLRKLQGWLSALQSGSRQSLDGVH